MSSLCLCLQSNSLSQGDDIQRQVALTALPIFARHRGACRRSAKCSPILYVQYRIQTLGETDVANHASPPASQAVHSGHTSGNPAVPLRLPQDSSAHLESAESRRRHQSGGAWVEAQAGGSRIGARQKRAARWCKASDSPRGDDQCAPPGSPVRCAVIASNSPSRAEPAAGVSQSRPIASTTRTRSALATMATGRIGPCAAANQASRVRRGESAAPAAAAGSRPSALAAAAEPGSSSRIRSGAPGRCGNTSSRCSLAAGACLRKGSRGLGFALVRLEAQGVVLLMHSKKNHRLTDCS